MSFFIDGYAEYKLVHRQVEQCWDAKSPLEILDATITSESISFDDFTIDLQSLKAGYGDKIIYNCTIESEKPNNS